MDLFKSILAATLIVFGILFTIWLYNFNAVTGAVLLVLETIACLSAVFYYTW